MKSFLVPVKADGVFKFDHTGKQQLGIRGGLLDNFGISMEHRESNRQVAEEITEAMLASGYTLEVSPYLLTFKSSTETVSFSLCLIGEQNPVYWWILL